MLKKVILTITILASLFGAQALAGELKIVTDVPGSEVIIPFESNIQIQVLDERLNDPTVPTTPDPGVTEPEPLPVADLPQYCTNGTGNFRCSANLNFDNIYEPRGEVKLFVRSGETLSIPFTTSDSTTSVGLFQYTTSDDLPPGIVPWQWLSEFPNGPEISPDCLREQGFRGNQYWTQDLSVGPGACFLGNTPRVLHWNTTVPGLPREHYFDVARQVITP